MCNTAEKKDKTKPDKCMRVMKITDLEAEHMN